MKFNLTFVVSLMMTLAGVILSTHLIGNSAVAQYVGVALVVLSDLGYHALTPTAPATATATTSTSSV